MDPLQQALKEKEKHIFYNIPRKYEQIFKQKEYDLEYFGLSLFHRAICFIVCFGIALLSFFYSMMRIFTAVLYPAQFILPYALSNFLFFVMFGFLLGFKSYFTNLFSEKKRTFTSFFIVCTLLTLYSALSIKSYFINLSLCVLQICSFVIFSLTFIPGGTNGIYSIFSLVTRK
jgi:hypothetical protein